MARQTPTDTTPRAPRQATAAPGSRPIETVPGLSALAEAVLTLETTDEVERFLRDLCTLPELEALTHRWQTVLLLDEGVPYVEIAGRVPTSTATLGPPGDERSYLPLSRAEVSRCV